MGGRRRCGAPTSNADRQTLLRADTAKYGRCSGDPAAQPNSAAGALVVDLAIAGGACVVCGSVLATPRPELPLKSTVWCWAVMAPPELQADNDVEDLAEGMPA
jgi:hypothetical protein